MLNQVIEFLQVRPGYVKEGGERLSNILNTRGVETTPDECREAIRQYNRGTYVMEEAAKAVLAPRILLLDIETAPMNVYVWKMWKTDVYTDQVEKDWFCLTWSAKWLFDEHVYSAQLTPNEAIACDDKRLMGEIWDLINEADIIIAHNGDDFDLPKLNMRFLYHGFPPATPYQTIDTLKVLRKVFGFSSNKLDYVAKSLGLAGKLDTGGFETWVGCMKGNQDSLDKMAKYNVGDTLILEEIYLKIRPWVKAHPNCGLYMETTEEVCPNCGSAHITPSGYYYTQVGRYQAFRCECGAIGRRRINTVTKEARNNLTISIAK